MKLVSVDTPLGRFQFELLDKKAPATCAHFCACITEGSYRDASVFRIVGPPNHQQDEPHPIEVVQLGPRGCIDSEHQHVPFESTAMTGIKHLKGTVSAARVNPDYLFGSFFVCMRDEPALDYGAGRHPDRQGFAAFGQIVSGFDVLERIMERAEHGDFLEEEIPVLSVSLESVDEPSQH